MAVHKYLLIYFLLCGLLLSLTLRTSQSLAGNRLPIKNLANDSLPIAVKQQVLSGNYLQALPFLNDLAQQGNARAQYQLGLFYLNGLSVEKSSEKALVWLMKSAKFDKKASYLLGDLYQQGSTFPKNLTKAKRYFELAIKQGDQRAKTKLSRLITAKQSYSIEEVQQSFFQAIKRGDIAQSRLYYQQGAQLDKRNIEGITPLLTALKYQQTSLAFWLIEVANNKSKGRTKVTATEALLINAKDNQGNSALHLAVEYNAIELANVLIRYGAKVSQVNNNNQTPLIVAITSNYQALAQFLVNQRSQLNIKDNFNKTALDYVKASNIPLVITATNAPLIEPDITKVIEVLVQQANDQQSPYYQWPILSIAIAQKQLKVVEYLLQGESITLQGKSASSNAISIALANAEIDLAIKLLEARKQSALEQTTLLHIYAQAIKQGQLAFIGTLIKGEYLKAIKNIPLEETPIGLAITANNTEIFKRLVKSFPLTNPQNSSQVSYLLLATKQNLTEISQQLIALNVDNSIQDEQGRNALWYAADHGNEQLIKILSLVTTAIDQADFRGHTPLMRAVSTNCYNCAKLLVEQGADPQKMSLNDNSALMFAAQGKAKILALFISKGASIGERNGQSFTPLMLAIQSDCFACLRTLLDAGANPRRKNKQGDNAFDLVRENEQMLALLEQY